VLLNAESVRETPAMVSFGDKQRFIGVHAAGKVRGGFWSGPPLQADP
jgi:hypothetical protein